MSSECRYSVLVASSGIYSPHFLSVTGDSTISCAGQILILGIVSGVTCCLGRGWWCGGGDIKGTNKSHKLEKLCSLELQMKVRIAGRHDL